MAFVVDMSQGLPWKKNSIISLLRLIFIGYQSYAAFRKMSTFLLGPFIETQSSKWLKIFKKKRINYFKELVLKQRKHRHSNTNAFWFAKISHFNLFKNVGIIIVHFELSYTYFHGMNMIKLAKSWFFPDTDYHIIFFLCCGI